jgi:hypothetical protein
MKQLLPTIALALGLSALPPAHAQQTQPAAEQETPTEKIEPLDRRLIKEFSPNKLSYEGIADMLRHHFPELNIVVEENLKNEPAPHMRILNSRLLGILKAIEIASPRIKAELSVGNIVGIRSTDPSGITGKPKPTVRVFQIGPYLRYHGVGYRPSDEAAAGLDKAMRNIQEPMEKARVLLIGQGHDVGMPTFSLHEDSQLLIAAGTPEALQVLTEIIYSLPEMNKPENKASSEAQGSK